jgi:hypothetical protein
MLASLRSVDGWKGWKKWSRSVSKKGIVSRGESESRCGCLRCVCPQKKRRKRANGCSPVLNARSKSCGRRRCSWLAGSCRLGTLDAHDFSAEELFWLYRNRWQIELLIKQMKQFLLLVRLRSRHPETVRATSTSGFSRLGTARRGRASSSAHVGDDGRTRAAEPGASLPSAPRAVGS